jgi:ABC-type nitrate/sulfonate/bicarbonate transport system substrate-binding protein
VVSLRKNNITKPSDLIGKKLAVPDVNQTSVKAMLTINHVDPTKLSIVPYQYDPTPLLKGDVDATIDFVTDVPYTIQQKGADPTTFLLADVGFRIYNDTVVVTNDTLAKRSVDLAAFLRASRKGWAEALADPAGTVASLQASYLKGTGRDAPADTFMANAEKPLMDNADGIYALTPAGISDNVRSLNAANVAATADVFVTSVVEASK